MDLERGENGFMCLRSRSDWEFFIKVIKDINVLPLRDKIMIYYWYIKENCSFGVNMRRLAATDISNTLVQQISA